MRVLVACEMSGRVRDAFRALGHEAWSCDLLPNNSMYHIQDDVRRYLVSYWDLLIAHPPCTYLCTSGAQYWPGKKREQEEALEFVRGLLAAPIPRIAVENPVSYIASRIRKPDQIIQPWQFGHSYSKRTCLWLKNLPLLVPTKIMPDRADYIHSLSPTKYRSMQRSLTFPGIARAMAEQWGTVQGTYVLPDQPAREYRNIMPQRKVTVRKTWTLLHDY